MVKSPFTRDETNSLADPVQRSRKCRLKIRRMRLGPAVHDESRIDFVVLVDSVEAFDKGHADCNPNADTYCILNVSGARMRRKPLIPSTGIMQADSTELMLI